MCVSENPLLAARVTPTWECLLEASAFSMKRSPALMTDPLLRILGLGSWKPGSLLAGSAQRSLYHLFCATPELPQAEAIENMGTGEKNAYE